MENFDKILKCITHVIYLMLQTAKTMEQNDHIITLVSQLIRINPRSTSCEDTLLHLCTSKSNTVKSGYFLDEDPIVSKICLKYKNC